LEIPSNSVCELASTLLSIDVNQLSFPNEQDAAALFSDYSGLSLFSAGSSGYYIHIYLMIYLLLWYLRSSSFDGSGTPFWPFLGFLKRNLYHALQDDTKEHVYKQ